MTHDQYFKAEDVFQYSLIYEQSNGVIIKKRQGLDKDLQVNLVRKGYFQFSSCKFQMSEVPNQGEIVTQPLESIISALLSSKCCSINDYSMGKGREISVFLCLKWKGFYPVILSRMNIKLVFYIVSLDSSNLHKNDVFSYSPNKNNWFVGFCLIAVLWRNCSQYKQVTSNEDLVRTFFFLFIRHLQI